MGSDAADIMKARSQSCAHVSFRPSTSSSLSTVKFSPSSTVYHVAAALQGTMSKI